MSNFMNYSICDWIGDESDLGDFERPILTKKFKQFQIRLPTAVTELKKVVAPAGICLDYSVESLALLQDWLIHGARQYGVEHGWPERSHQVGFSMYPNKINRMTVLSPYWKSLASDSAIYLGAIFQRECPLLSWKMMYRRDIERGYPYLTGWPSCAPATGFSIWIPYRVLLNTARGEQDSDNFLTQVHQYYSESC